MSEDGKRRSLGRGLSALLGEDQEDTASLDKMRLTRVVPVETVYPGRFQPRRTIDPDGIADLIESVRDKGILQPILVRRRDGEAETFEIIAGERRWRAAQGAQLHEIPIIIKELTDQEAMEIALVENLQRQDLTPLEEAEGYRRLMDEFAHNQEDLGKVVGKSRSHVANMMRLLNLPQPIKELLDKGDLSAGHARALLTASDPIKLAKQVVDRGLNVRQTEKLAQTDGAKKKAEDAVVARDAGERGGETGGAGPRDIDTVSLERDLSNMLGLKVTVSFHGRGGTLAIHYHDLDQLDDILKRLSHTPSAKVPPIMLTAPMEDEPAPFEHVDVVAEAADDGLEFDTLFDEEPKLEGVTFLDGDDAPPMDEPDSPEAEPEPEEDMEDLLGDFAFTLSDDDVDLELEPEPSSPSKPE